mmetsp:Transcript_33321/g.33930  ORF Transcript_33321/g.33930 Transcript_33321/m.33930 type:complete len:450 (+) Transcript_33321:298-1647(+)
MWVVFPKKIMHYSGLVGHAVHDAQKLGWKIRNEGHEWSELVDTVSNHVRMLNFRYRVGLKSGDVNYINGLASFVDNHTIEYTTKSSKEPVRVTAENILIAVGGRPSIPDIPGAKEYAVTSDDIFHRQESPGKTLCVGGSYISLECAGFLTELGYEVSVAVRSILLRGFDRQCAQKIGNIMEELGTNFIYDTIPLSITRLSNGQLEVSLRRGTGEVFTECFNTVLFATGRTADLTGLNLSAAGVNISPDGKLCVNNERTNVSNIYAVGDVCEGTPELTPVAIKAGELLAKRLYGKSSAEMNYSMIPTTVFTPMEYGTVGLSEEAAITKYGEENIEVFLTEFKTLEFAAAHRYKHAKFGDEEDIDSNCLSKLICLKTKDNLVVGFHYVGPNAGEITQGFALAVKLGATKEDFENLVGIHPTDAESFCTLDITKSSGEDWNAGGGCGGGKCG